MRKYFVFIGTFLLSFIGAGIFLIGIMKLIDDANPGFINNPPSIVGIFIVFLAIPYLIAYYVAFEFKKSKKMTGLEIEHDHEKGAEVEKPQHHKKESHWLFALIATFAIGGVIIGLHVIFPGTQWEPYSFTSINENSEFPKNSIFEASNSGEINDWKTYANNKYKYSLKYPVSWVIDDQNTDEVVIQKQDGSIKYFFSISFIDEPYEQYLYIATTGADLVQNKTFNGQVANKLTEKGTFQDGGKFYSLKTIIKIKNSTYSLWGFVTSHNQEDMNKLSNIYNQILSTFKFTN